MWAPAGASAVASMHARLEPESPRLEWLGLTHRSFQRVMLQRIAGSWSPAEFDALRALAQALEHQKDYTREASTNSPPTSLAPLNRLVDAVYPESDVSRRFSLKADLFVGSSCQDRVLEADIRMQLAEWTTVDDRLQALAQRSLLVKEAAPASAALSQAPKIPLTAPHTLPTPPPLSSHQPN